jgi:hypothetical protein
VQWDWIAWGIRISTGGWAWALSSLKEPQAHFFLIKAHFWVKVENRSLRTILGSQTFFFFWKKASHLAPDGAVKQHKADVQSCRAEQGITMAGGFKVVRPAWSTSDHQLGSSPNLHHEGPDVQGPVVINRRPFPSSTICAAP